MTDEDWWSKWFRRRGWPFSSRSMFGDIDDMFREMEEMMGREFEELSEKAPKDLVRERRLPDGTKVKSWGPFVYGYSVTMGPDRKPQVREFGNIKPGSRMGKPSLDLKEEREPLVDIMEDDGELRVVVELPGVKKEDIKLHGTEDSLTVSVDTPQRKYRKNIDLPAKINLKQAESSYNNGVLEIILPKVEEEEPEGEPINIE
ncbi:MAG: archaeal heat shock protein Hsp20 [Thermoproteota archaeon]